MKKLKNIILVVVAVSLVRCQKKGDETILELQNQNIYTGEVINKETVELDNPIILKQVNKINENSIKSKGTKTASPTIKTDKSLRIIGESMTSYTFEVASNNTITSGIAQNYVLVQYTDNSFIQYFANYKINEYGVTDKYPFEIQKIEGKSLVNLKSRGCTEDVAFVNDKNCLYLPCTAGLDHSWSDRGECAGNHTSKGPQKICETTSVTFQTSCPNTGGGGGTNTGSGTSQGGSESITVGFWSSAEIIARRLQLEQNSEELKYLKDNPEIASIINRKFMTIPSDPVKIEFAEEAIKTLINGGEVDFEDLIINQLSGKVKCIYDKIKKSGLLDDTLGEFEGEEAQVHLILKQENISEENVSGDTEYGDTIIIRLDISDMTNTPTLWAVSTILHEAIHAKIYRMIRTRSRLLYDRHTQTYSLPDGSRADFPTLFDYYNNFPENPQHNFMADYYRDAMEKGLKEYAQSIGKNYPDQLYKDIAWGGLHNTEAWNNMFADPVFTRNEQRRIIQSIKNFKNSDTDECK